jgi:hypothetical protein
MNLKNFQLVSKTFYKYLLISIGILVFILYSLFLFHNSARADITIGLVGYWNFDEGSGTTAADSSGNNNTGTLTNGPSWTTGKIGQALNFDNVDDNVSISKDLLGTSSSTIAAWIYAKGYGEGGYGNVVANGYTSFALVGWDAKLYFTSDNSSHQTVSASNSLPLNQWVFVAVTRTKTGITNFYINGALNGAPNQNSGTPFTIYNSTFIGNSINGNSTFDGLIDEVRIYNRVLSSTEISELYNYSGGGTPTPTQSGAPTPTPSVTSTPTPSATATPTPTPGCSWAGNTGTVSSPYSNTDVADCVTDAAGKTGNVIITIPTSTPTWSTAVTINMSSGWTNVTGLIIQGAGQTSTVITANSNRLFYITGKNTIAFRMTALGLSGAGDPTLGVVQVEGNFFTCRFDHININQTTTKSVVVGFYSSSAHLGLYSQTTTNYDKQKILFDHINFTNTSGTWLTFLMAYGRWQNWTDNDDWGTDNAIFIENSTFTYSGNAFITDTEGGVRLVFRYNTCINAGPATHDVSNYGRRGSRIVENYGNSYTCTGSCDPYGVSPVGNRGGSGLIYNNKITGWINKTSTEIWRVVYNFAQILPGYYCKDTGSIKLCEDLVRHCTGGTKKGCVQDADCPIGTCNPSTICTTDDDCGFTTTGVRCVQLDGADWITGAPVGWPCRDQIGRGKDIIATGGQEASPVYFWHNGPEDACMIEGGACSEISTWNCSSAGIYCAKDRDYCMHSPATDCGTKAEWSYTAYAYPHPLAIASGTPDTTPPAAPTGVAVN